MIRTKKQINLVMAIKPKLAAASTSVLRFLLRINKNVGSTLASGLEVMDKTAQSSQQSAINTAERQPSFVHTVLGFAKTIYMRPSKVVTEKELIEAHERWEAQLISFLQSRSDSAFSSKNYTFNEPCELCDWLKNDAQVRWGKNPILKTLVERHTYFHDQADLLMEYTKQGEHAKAHSVLDSSFRYGSSQTVLLLNKLKTLQKAQASMH